MSRCPILGNRDRPMSVSVSEILAYWHCFIICSIGIGKQNKKQVGIHQDSPRSQKIPMIQQGLPRGVSSVKNLWQVLTGFNLTFLLV